MHILIVVPFLETFSNPKGGYKYGFSLRSMLLIEHSFTDVLGMGNIFFILQITFIVIRARRPIIILMIVELNPF